MRRILALVVLPLLATVAAAEQPPRYSALDTIKRAEIGTFSPALRQAAEKPARNPVREDRRRAFEPRWGVVCRPNPAEPGALVCDPKK